MVSAHLTARRIRRLRAVIGSLVVVLVIAGLTYTWWSALQRHVAEAIVGASATLMALGLGLAWSISLRIGVALLRLQHRTTRLERRVSGLAQRNGAHEPAGPATSDQGVAALLRLFQRFSDGQEARMERIERLVAGLESPLRAAGHSFAAKDAPDHATEAGTWGRNLRREFAELIHLGDYVGALAAGDAITGHFPHSQAASDFRRVRPLLARTIHLTRKPAGP